MDGATEGSTPNGGSRILVAADPRATDHLNKLAERNRVKRALNAKSREQQAQEQLERGFSTHFRGANASPGDTKATPIGKDAAKVFVSGKTPQILRASPGFVPAGEMRRIRGIQTASELNSLGPVSMDSPIGDTGESYPKIPLSNLRRGRYASGNDNDSGEEQEQDQEGEGDGEEDDELFQRNVGVNSPGLYQEADYEPRHYELMHGSEQVADSSHRDAPSVANVEGALAAKSDSVHLDPDLLNNVAALSPEQQAALLQMLLGGRSNASSTNVQPESRQGQSSSISAVSADATPTRVLSIKSRGNSTDSPFMPNRPPPSPKILRDPSPIRPSTESSRPYWLQQEESSASAEVSGVEAERPSWLPQTQIQTKPEGFAADIPSSREIRADLQTRPSSGRRPSPYRPEEYQYQPSVRVKTPVLPNSNPTNKTPDSGNSAASSARRRRRKDANQGADVGSAHLDSLLSSGRREPGSEELLRQSLAAISIADKSNRGRIHATAGGNSATEENVMNGDLEVSRSLFVSDSRANLPFSLGSGISGNITQPVQVERGPVKLIARSSPPAEPPARQGSRSNLLGSTVKRNIDITNEKVQSAMADLRGVLAGIQDPIDGKAFQGPASDPSNDFDMPTRSESSAVLIGSEVKRRIDRTTEKVDGAITDLHEVLAELREPSGLIRRNPSNEVLKKFDGISKQSEMPSPVSAPSVSPQRNLEESANFDMVHIPYLPTGRSLSLEILSTWGDPHYVGLAGLDIFDSAGAILTADSSARAGIVNPNVQLAAPVRTNAAIVSICGDPPDINVLPEYASDPRTVHNLLDGCNFTRDDLHVWLAPLGFCQREVGPDGLKPLAVVNLKLSKPTVISMIRIFNYNKSRTHAARGVRLCRILLDDVPVFQGEIRMAPGLLSSPDQVSETILFTTDEEVLTEIARHDEARGYYVSDATTSWVSKLLDRHKAQRPRTVDDADTSTITISRHRRAPIFANASDLGSNLDVGPRPATQATGIFGVNASPSPLRQGQTSTIATASASSLRASRSNSSMPIMKSVIDEDKVCNEEELFMRELRELNCIDPELKNSSLQSIDVPTDNSLVEENDAVLCSSLRLYIESAWDPASDFVGLMGVQLLLTSGPLYLASHLVSVETPHSSAEYMGDDTRIVANICDGCNDCTDDKHAWLAPFVPGNEICIVLRLPSPKHVVGLRIWNYNKVSMPEFVLRGVRSVRVSVVLAGGIEKSIGRALLRPGPGSDCVQFAQNLMLSDIQSGLHCGPNLSRAPLACLGATGALPRYVAPVVNQDYETLQLPCGLLWRIVITENWNDGYFVGLDGLELFDHTGSHIVPAVRGKTGEAVTISAFPYSINDLMNSVEAVVDPRTPDRLLFSDEYDRPGGSTHQPWLAPLGQCMSQDERDLTFAKHLAATIPNGAYRPTMNVSTDTNSVYLLFHRPISLSAIRFYNYSKNPARGVRHFSLYCDHKLVFMGSLLSADKEKNIGGQRRGQAVMLTAHARIVKADRDIVSYCGSTDQDVLCVNERKVMVRSRTMYTNTPNVAADGVQSDLSQRPRTAAQIK